MPADSRFVKVPEEAQAGKGTGSRRTDYDRCFRVAAIDPTMQRAMLTN